MRFSRRGVLAGAGGAAALAALHDDTESHAFHLAAGFVETERVVYFRQEL